MVTIPLMLNLKNKNVLVIGGGRIAKRRVTTLLPSGALITIVSPQLDPDLHSFFKQGKLNWKQKNASPEDLKDAHLIIIATNDPTLNQEILDAAPDTAFVNAAGEANRGNLQFPTFFRKGKLTVALSTNGASPMLATQLKRQLADQFDDQFEHYMDFLFEARVRLKQSALSDHEKKQHLKELLNDRYQDPKNQQLWLSQFK